MEEWSVTHRGVLTILHVCFLRFLDCTNGTKSCNETTKQQYFAKNAKTLSDPNISSKNYWSIL